jgi:DNA mismatch repair protein MutL
LRVTSSRIAVLPPELADQIAAGEVVERPASVVKELVENALDAGARRVDVEIERGGLGLVSVSDDGSGMTPDEAHLALKRHATSKLRALDDLYTLASMGFRGEALPSIASVSKLTLTTRHHEAPDGDGAYQLSVDGGIAREGRRVGGPVGTRVEVRDLFGNVPARLKFVKAEATESAHVSETVLRLALAFPQVHFRLRSDGRNAIDLAPHASGLERAKVALGKGRAPAKLHAAAGEEGGVAIAAYLGSPAESANTSRCSYLFVNRRFVRDRSLLHAVMMGYGETLERGRYPFAVVHLTMAGDGVDVNVHPQKLEVRFSRAQDVYAAVRHAVASGVATAPWLTEPAGSALTVYSLPPINDAVDRGFGRAREPQLGYAERRKRAEEAMKMFAPPQGPLFAAPWLQPSSSSSPASSDPERDAGAPAEATGFFSSLIYLGQLHRTYLVCQAPGELVLVDQHAAHERVAFQRLREAHANARARSQRLLLPSTIELGRDLAAMADEHQSLLARLGFELERFGDTTLLVRALPELVAQANPDEILTEVLSQLAARDSTELLDDELDHVLATMACHSVVRAGDVLDERQARALFASMDGIDFRAHCPHGRPVLLRLSLGELERRFGRT